MAYPGNSRLKRSFSEHIRVSTYKAWDVFWKSTRETRLSGQLSRVFPSPCCNCTKAQWAWALLRFLTWVQPGEAAGVFCAQKWQNLAFTVLLPYVWLWVSLSTLQHKAGSTRYWFLQDLPSCLMWTLLPSPLAQKHQSLYRHNDRQIKWLVSQANR